MATPSQMISSPYPVDLGFQVLAMGVPRPCRQRAILDLLRHRV